jgi:transcriptional regulator
MIYMPPQFDKSKDKAIAARLMREHPFASLISTDEQGFPYVTHLPLHLVQQGDGFKLLGHVAKPNPHWKYLQARPQALVTFMGPQAYMSPAVYPDLARVPTWNYLAVHARVSARLLEGEAAKDTLLKLLINDHEPAYAQQWRDLGQEFQHKMLAGIVAFELVVDQLACKVKLNQHRLESHAAMHARYAQGSAQEQALARWMVDVGMSVSPTPDS